MTRWKIMVARGEDVLAGPTIDAVDAVAAQAEADAHRAADSCDYARELPISAVWAVELDPRCAAYSPADPDAHAAASEAAEAARLDAEESEASDREAERDGTPEARRVMHLTRMPEEMRGPCDECCGIVSASARNLTGYPAEVVAIAPAGSRSLCGIHAGLRRCDECRTRSLRGASPCALCAEAVRS